MVTEDRRARIGRAETCFAEPAVQLNAAGSGAPLCVRQKNLNFSPISSPLVSILYELLSCSAAWELALESKTCDEDKGCFSIGHYQNERKAGSESIPQRRLGSFGGAGFERGQEKMPHH